MRPIDGAGAFSVVLSVFTLGATFRSLARARMRELEEGRAAGKVVITSLNDRPFAESGCEAADLPSRASGNPCSGKGVLFELCRLGWLLWTQARRSSIPSASFASGAPPRWCWSSI
ncbi:hypothetical protein GCM10027203_41520 [Nonomuraea fastidiosa]